MPETFRHHLIGFSFADSVAPFFIFIAGVGFRISFLRNAEASGVPDAKEKALFRFLVLTAIGIFFLPRSAISGVMPAMRIHALPNTFG